MYKGPNGQNCKFSSFWLSDLCHRNFAHFQGRRKRRTERTPIEDNAENGQNYMAEAFGPLYTEGSFSLWKKSGYLWEAWAGYYPDKAVLLGRRRGNILEAGNGLKRKAIRATLPRGRRFSYSFSLVFFLCVGYKTAKTTLIQTVLDNTVLLKFTFCKGFGDCLLRKPYVDPAHGLQHRLHEHPL